jgi:hypothetical protein
VELGSSFFLLALRPFQLNTLLWQVAVLVVAMSAVVVALVDF